MQSQHYNPTYNHRVKFSYLSFFTRLFSCFKPSLQQQSSTCTVSTTSQIIPIMARRDYPDNPSSSRNQSTDDINSHDDNVINVVTDVTMIPLQPSVSDHHLIPSTSSISDNTTTVSSSPIEIDIDSNDLDYSEYTPITQHQQLVINPPQSFVTSDLDFINSFSDDVVPFMYQQPLSNPSSSSSTLSTFSNSQSTLLDMPNEVIDLILGYLSSRPNSKNPIWDDKLDCIDTMQFALSCSRIYNLFRYRLTSIRTRPGRYREEISIDTQRSGIIIDTKNEIEISHFGFILRLAGESLEELIISKSLRNHKWVESYEKYVCNLIKLSLRDVNSDYPLERILKISSRTLKQLEIIGETGKALSENQLHALATHCSSVDSLTLRLSLFEHDWTPVWMGIGPGLRKLSLGATRFWILDSQEIILLEQIGRYCNDLKDLHFYHLGDMLGEGCAKLCIRYGNQLERLEFEQSQMILSHLTMISNHCINTKFSFSHGSSVISHEYNMDVIQLFGSRIESLKYKSRMSHDESLTKVGDHCNELKELRLDCASSISEENLNELLRKVGSTIEKLDMNFFVGMHDDHRIGASLNGMLLTLSENVKNLKELSLGGKEIDTEKFDKLMKKCKKSLTRLTITFGIQNEGDNEINRRDRLVRIVTSLHQVEKLKDLKIIDRTNTRNVEIEELKNACYELRDRVERIVICGVVYVK